MSANGFINKVWIEGFGPIRQGSWLTLTRLHALIGPNDVGKSMALRAIQAAALGQWDGALLAQTHSPSPRVELSFGGMGAIPSWKLTPTGVEWGNPVPNDSFALKKRIEPILNVRECRFDPKQMRQGHKLIRDRDDLWFKDETGLGLGALLDALLARRPREFFELEELVKAKFPSVNGFRMWTDDTGRRIGVRLKDGTEVPPENLSEGLLYFIGFALVQHLARPGILLVEEPENGLHPSRVGEVVAMLRALSLTTQVLIATHSPLVINELRPEEVTVVTRDDESTRFTPISETPNFEERSKAYALGELWLSYADGKDESALLQGTSRLQ